MTDPTAPSGRKLTEEQVFWFATRSVNARTQNNKHGGCDPTETKHLCDDWRTLRAECAAKDAEIARLKGVIADMVQENQFASRELARAEARLAAMANVTEDDIARGLRAFDRAEYSTRSGMVRAILEVFVANKTAGGT